MIGDIKGEIGILVEPILVGREHELEILQNHLDLVVQGKGTTVFISGEAGSGKTRLVNEFLDSLKQKSDFTELKGWCLSNSGVPYFPFVEAFNIYPSSAPARDEEMGLKVWLMGPKKSGNPQEIENLSPQAWKDSTFAAVTQFLFSISAKKPTILFIDDLQWADTASLALLHYISRFILSQKVLVLATFRSEDLIPDSEGHPHPLVDAIRLMGREQLFSEIKLPNLDRSDVSLIAENMVDGRVQSEFAQKLSDESQGNPLFVIESLKMLSEKGSLVQENDRWQLSTDEIGIPTMIKDILLRRIDSLKPNQRKILEIASVMGSRFDPRLLGEVATQDSLETLEILNGIAKATSLVVCERSDYRFGHAKYRDVLYEEISLPLRKAYHGKIAEKMENSCRSDEKLPVEDLAFHYAQAGNEEKSVKYSLAAGEEALRIYSGAEAIKNFRYVLDVTRDDPKYSKERIIALEGLGDGLFARGRCGEAVKAFEQLNNFTTSNLVKSRVLGKAINASFFWGEYSLTLDFVNSMVEYPELNSLDLARVRFSKAKAKAWGGEFLENFKAMEESLRVFEGEYSLSDMHNALLELTTTYISNNKLENAIAAGIRSCALTEYSKNAGDGASVYSWLGLTYFLTKLEDEGLKSVKESFKLSEKISDPISRAFVETTAYWLSGQLIEAKAASKLFSGLPLQTMRSFGKVAKIKFFMSSIISGALSEFKQSLKAAIAESLKGAECADQTDSCVYKTFNYGNLIREYAALGDMEQAKKYYDKFVQLYEETSISGIFHPRSAHASVKASYFSSQKQWKEANQFHEEAINILLSGSTDQVMAIAGERQAYCWTLLQQGRFEDAKMQFEKAKEIMDNLDKRFMHSNVLGHLIAPIRVELIKEFNMRLDLINVAKNSGVLIRIEDCFPKDFKVITIQPNYRIQNDSIELNKKTINPFTDEVITLTAQATKTGTFNLNPKLIYIDDLGETKISTIDPVTITVHPPSK